MNCGGAMSVNGPKAPPGARRAALTTTEVPGTCRSVTSRAWPSGEPASETVEPGPTAACGPEVGACGPGRAGERDRRAGPDGGRRAEARGRRARRELDDAARMFDVDVGGFAQPRGD